MFKSVNPAELRDAGAGGWHYRAVRPEEATEEFPSVLGVSSPASEAGTVTLVAAGAEGNVKLAVHAGENNPDRHESRGIAAGTYLYDMALKRNGAWSGVWATKFLNDGTKPVAWRPDDPPNGVYTLYFHVSPDTAEEIRLREQEHIDDFTRAWGLSIGFLQWGVEQLVPAHDAEAALNQLVGVLQNAEVAYLIPADPANLEAWGQRAIQAYVNLCDQSKKRDNGEHSPASYQCDWQDDGERKTIMVQPIMKPAKGNSAGYILPGDVPVVHTGGGLEDVGGEGAEVGAEATFNAGDKVTWKLGTQINFWDSESDYYLTPQLDGDNIGDLPGVQKAVADGVFVHSLLDEQTVVLATTIDGNDAYVKARLSVLQHA
jgi:hypothetical protein